MGIERNDFDKLARSEIIGVASSLFTDGIDEDKTQTSMSDSDILTQDEVSSIMSNELSEEELLEQIKMAEEEIEMPALKGSK